MIDVSNIPPEKPVLIAGPTASGKSSLALEIAESGGGVIINADALQVFDGWRILTARPDEHDLARVPHLLYGHIGFDQDYSVGQWLRQVSEILQNPPARPIIVGGTGLYFKALTEGLAEIPATPPGVRALATERLAQHGLAAMLSELDAETRSRLDQQNPVRVQRAWEVQQATGRSIANWQDATPAPILPLEDCTPIVIDAPRDWLTPRIEHRFDLMLQNGALDEARAMLPRWNPAHLSSKAIGASELIAHLNATLSLAQAHDLSCIASRQYAKRQRSWFRAKMGRWNTHAQA